MVMKLTDKQGSIITADPASPTLVLAGPGTGKTEVLARRLVYLLDNGIRPSQLLVLSFSRNAVRNVSDRIRKITTVDEATLIELRHLVVRTFDSWAFRVLRLCGESVDDLLKGSYDDNIRKLALKIRGDESKKVSEKLENIRHIVVDELQDLSGWRGELVIELLRLLRPPASERAGFTLLGDPAQSIYGFSIRNSGQGQSTFTPKNLIDTVRTQYDGELYEECLISNFRSTSQISAKVDKSREILLSEEPAEYKLERIKEIIDNESDVDINNFGADGVQDSPIKNFAILCENNGLALSMGMKLFGQSDDAPAIPIVVTAGSPARSVPCWVGACLGRFKGAQISKPHFEKVYKYLFPAAENRSELVPAMEDAWELLTHAAEKKNANDSVDIALLRARLNWPDLFPDDEGLHESSIEITTIHQSKGLEYDQVSLARLENQNGSQQTDDGGLLEEANVLFVALSRASQEFNNLKNEYPPNIYKHCLDKGNRIRWCNWWKRGFNCELEIGLSGDIAPTSFVSTDLFGSSEDAMENQSWLASNAAELRGKKVVLVKNVLKLKEDKIEVVYDVHLQVEKKTGRLLARTNSRLTFDILEIFKKLGGSTKYSLPPRIFNLRIADIVTLTASGDQLNSVHEPWKTSGLWVGIRIHGLGFFKRYKKK